MELIQVLNLKLFPPFDETNFGIILFCVHLVESSVLFCEPKFCLNIN